MTGLWLRPCFGSCGFSRSFYRQVPLPEGAKTDTATAEFIDGVLQITMQAPEREPKTRRLEIKEGEETTKAKAAA
ncbi:MAG TPA: Hsp20 family protein [Pyrinomonadaceae bacterium]|nr:Hsp20 family protein [Pyrinomonadaceae bacterium]